MLHDMVEFEIKRNVEVEEVKTVAAIKALRSLTGLGLKESKHIIDRARMAPENFVVKNVEDSKIHDTVVVMRQAGFKLSCKGRHEEYVQQLKELACVATMKGDYYFASKLTAFMDDL